MAEVYKAINAVQASLAKIGISKSRKADKYMFRGIDDVYSALAPLLAEHKLCVIPNVLTRVVEEKISKAGATLFYVTVHARFDFVSSEDGSKHEAHTFGEAMDSGDKATNKAMSAAYKYAAFMTFCIPTEGDNDSETQTHEVVTRPVPDIATRTAAFKHKLESATDEKAFEKSVSLGGMLMNELAKNDEATHNELLNFINLRREELTSDRTV